MRLQVDITRQDFLDFNIHHYKKNQMTSTIVTGTIGLLVVLFLLHRDKTSLDFGVIGITIFVYVISYFLILKYLLKRSKNIPQEHGALLGVKEFNFGDERIEYADKNSSGQYLWSAITKISESKNALYLFLDSNMAIVIPKRSFRDKGHEEDFKSHVGKRIKLA